MLFLFSLFKCGSPILGKPRLGKFGVLGVRHVGIVSVGDMLTKWREKFKQESISEPLESIEYILSHCLRMKSVFDIYRLKTEVLNETKIQEIELLCRERLRRMPIQYVVGEWEFRGVSLKMSPPVFIPRPETEQLVDIVLNEISEKEDGIVLDLCCGSGPISLSLLQERPLLEAIAVDQSADACQLTELNAERNGLNGRIRVILGDVAGVDYGGKFRVIVSNPPYVLSEDLANLQPEIKLYEDLAALDGGPDGLALIKPIFQTASALLIKTGKLFMEVDPRHPRLLRNYLEERPLGLTYARTFRDFCGKDRFVEIIKSQQ